MIEKDFRIMVIDDEPVTAEAITLGIQAHKEYAIQVFNNPVEAVNSFMENPVHLVITDLKMPETDGFEVIEKMHDRNLSTNFIVITGEKKVTSVIQSRWLGANYLFFKPVDYDELLKAIDETYQRVCYWEKRLKEV